MDLYYNSNIQPQPNRKIAIYARVSTEHETQLLALENQKDWYKPILAQHPEWEVIETYIDKGITGTSAQKRPRFMQMIEDAENGAFDLILTREVSRFARNTIDTLYYTRILKQKNVEVYFINDNIRTFDGDGELRLTIMATLAQDESRKTSIRTKSGQKTSMEKGVFYGNGNILGYDRVGKSMVINEEQARTVRMIFNWYLEGYGLRAIQFKLEQAGALTAMGKTHWHMTNISKILQNTFYCGIITYNKQWTPNYLDHKKINNLGDVEQIVVRGTHEAIISESDFNKVQSIIQSRRKERPECGANKRRTFGEKPPSDVWVELLRCECGHKFNRKTWHKKQNTIQHSYQCANQVRTGSVRTREKKGLPIDDICDVPMIPKWKLQMMVSYIFKKYAEETAEILSLAESILGQHIDDTRECEDITKAIHDKEIKLEKLNKRLRNLIQMRADGDISKDEYNEARTDTEKQISDIEDEIQRITPQEDEATHEEKITLLKYYLQQSVYPSNIEDIPEDVIRAFVRQIVVHKNSFEWYLRFNDDAAENVFIEGKRKNDIKISSFSSLLHTRQLTKAGITADKVEQSHYILSCIFDINLTMVKKYMRKYPNHYKSNKWEDIKIFVHI